MKRILIIEDDISIAELERDYLEINGYETVIEGNGKKGLKKALEEEFNLIVLDLMLPEIDGFEICKRIRVKKNIPILMISARKEDIDKIRGLGLGADDYMTKPFSPNELVARVKAHITRFERLTTDDFDNQYNTMIMIRSLKIDELARKVFFNEKELVFTAKEYDLLVVLAKHPDRVFSKEELFNRIWGMDHCGDVATVPVHIKNLRKKIEVDSSNPQYIETVWGVGYRFKG